MMQSMRRGRRWLMECYKFNALLILLTLILHDRFSMVFGITVNPIDSLVSSSFDADEYDGDDNGDDQTNGFASQIHDLNKIDYNQFANGYNKYFGSSEIVSNESVAPHSEINMNLFSIRKS